MMEELSQVVLLEEVPEWGLLPGDIGTVVLVHPGGLGYEVEFMALTGETLAVVSLEGSKVRGVMPRDIAHARSYAHDVSL